MAGGPGPGGTLAERHARLLEKYDALVRKYEDESRSRLAVHRMSMLALRVTSEGLALVCGGRILGTNRRWSEIEVPWTALQGWQVEEVPLEGGGAPTRPGGREYRSLREMAVGETARPGPPARALVARSRGGRVAAIRVEEADGGPHPTHVVIVQDHTTLARTSAELATMHSLARQRDRLHALGELSAGIVHDVRSSLVALRLRLDVLRRHVRPAGEAPLHAGLAALALAEATLRRVDVFVGGRGPDEALALPEVLAEAVELVRPELEREGRIHLDVRASRELPPVRGSASDVRHVLVNLLINARDAMPDGGRITVRASARDGAARVSVIDDGRGIPPGDRARIFEPFFTTKGDRGTGLGLALAASTMAALGGSITVRDARGRGAEFRLVFPFADAPRPRPRSR